MGKITNFATKEFQESMACRSEMIHEARVWSGVKEISSLCNKNEISYDEFLEIVDIIIHFTHHEAELEERNMKMELASEDVDTSDCSIDIDDEDGWLIIPVIG